MMHQGISAIDAAMFFWFTVLPAKSSFVMKSPCMITSFSLIFCFWILFLVYFRDCLSALSQLWVSQYTPAAMSLSMRFRCSHCVLMHSLSSVACVISRYSLLFAVLLDTNTHTHPPSVFAILSEHLYPFIFFCLCLVVRSLWLGIVNHT